MSTLKTSILLLRKFWRYFLFFRAIWFARSPWTPFPAKKQPTSLKVLILSTLDLEKSQTMKNKPRKLYRPLINFHNKKKKKKNHTTLYQSPKLSVFTTAIDSNNVHFQFCMCSFQNHHHMTRRISNFSFLPTIPPRERTLFEFPAAQDHAGIPKNVPSNYYQSNLNVPSC